VLAHHVDGPGVDADDPAPTALRRALVPLAVDDVGRFREGHLSSVEVDVGPAEVEQLAPTRAV